MDIDPPPLALTFTHYSALMQFAHRHQGPVWLAICSTRESFTASLLAEDQDRTSTTKTTPPFSTAPSLAALARASKVGVTFLPDLQHFRAFATGLYRDGNSDDGLGDIPPALRADSLLVVLGLRRMLADDDLLTAQTLMNACAAAIAPCTLRHARLVFAEYLDPDAAGRAASEEDPPLSAEDRFWEARILILDRIARLGDDPAGLSGKTTALWQVFGRWCGFDTVESLLAGG